MHATTTQIVQIIARSSEIIRCWIEQKSSPATEDSIKDRDINATLRGLRMVRELGTPAQVAEIDRMMNAAESLLNSAHGPGGTFATAQA